MGHCNVIYGFIRSPLFGTERNGQLNNMNLKEIHNLPKHDFDYPYITSTMFSYIPYENKKKNVPLYDFQIIHFGASYKNLFYEWDKWLVKFESILKRLFWYEVVVHYDGVPDSFKYEWNAEKECIDNMHNHDSPMPINKWQFSGGPRIFT